MKTVCIYHSIDLDGFMSAAIVKHWFISKHGKDHLEYQYDITTKNTKALYKGAFETIKFDYPSITFIGYNYGQPIPDLSEYDEVIMCDISFPSKDFLKLYNQVNTNITVIDHHISAINELQELIDTGNIEKSLNGLRDTKFAACELTWKYFMSNPIEKFGEIEDQNPMPEIVRLLGRYDCFGHKGTDEEQKVLEFQYGARQCISNYEEAYIELLYSLQNYPIKSEISIHENGKVIYQYLCTEAKQTYKNGFEIILNERTSGFPNSIEFRTRKFICINKERFNPINFGIDYHKDGYDGCACFHYDGVIQAWAFSLYNDNGLVDCSQIAKQFGCGGHKGAAGFVTNNINSILNLQ